MSAGLVFWLGRERIWLLGDGGLWITQIQNGTLLWHNEPASLWGHFALNRLLGSPSPAITMAAVSIAAGIVFALLASRFCGRTLGQTPGALLAFALLMLSGFTRLFYGYVETYPLPAVGLTLFLMLGVRAVRSGKGATAAILAFVLTVPFHVSVLFTTPGALYLLWNHPPILRHRKRGLFLLLGAAVTVLGLLILSGLAQKLVATYGIYATKLLPLDGAEGNKVPYGLLSLPHLNDFFQEQLLLGPFAALLALPILLLRIPRGLPGEERFLLWAGLPLWGVSFFYNREIGAARDWDLFSVAAIPLLLFVGLTLARHPWWREERRLARRAGAILIAVTVFHTVPWVVGDTYPAQAMRRFRLLNHEDAHVAPFARAHAFEELYKIHLSSQDIPAAVDALTVAHRTQPHTPRYALNLATYLMRTGRAREALAALEITAPFAPGDSRLFYQLGHARWQTGDLDGARTAFRRSTTLNPGFEECYLSLARLELRDGSPLAGQVVLSEAARRFPNSGKLALLAGQISVELGDMDQAERLLGAVLRARPNEAQALTGMGRVHLSREDFPSAHEVLSHALRQDANLGEAWLGLGEAYEGMGDAANAVTSYHTATRFMPQDPEPVLRAARVMAQQGDLADAVDWLRAFAARDSASAGAGQALQLIEELQRP